MMTRISITPERNHSNEAHIVKQVFSARETKEYMKDMITEIMVSINKNNNVVSDEVAKA